MLCEDAERGPPEGSISMTCVVTEEIENAERCSKKTITMATSTLCREFVTKVAETYDVSEDKFSLFFERPDRGAVVDMFTEEGTLGDACNYTATRKRYNFIFGAAGWKPEGFGTGPLASAASSSKLSEGNSAASPRLTLAGSTTASFEDKSAASPKLILAGSTSLTLTGMGNLSVKDNRGDPPPYSYSPSLGTNADDISSKSATGYVGLVNQAMTCYLNSLLQTLFMTPEFRTAIYNAKYEVGLTSDDPHRRQHNIPYHLQRLFALLQTSPKRAIETTDVTKSFGWDSSEAWQQHDVQELCRVMFDALERSWAHTEQANLINQLYQGTMKDYVKCLQCGYESARKDSFLDVPLVIKPFGAHEAYGSVEQALKAFVEPETLQGNNQYFCESCNDKCDAHKGLKFIRFPYLLTLQLKRFDFDYNTMQRIKLNDKMTFPFELNLNGMVCAEEEAEEDSPSADAEPNGAGDKPSAEGTSASPVKRKVDLAGLTDGAPAGPGGCPLPHHLGGPTKGLAEAPRAGEEREEEEDEEESHAHGEGATGGADTDLASNNERNLKHMKGPHMYELFSIMIHSGSALGGHYYAYIKVLDGEAKSQWYSFNDQQVSPVTDRDIEKTYGGGMTRSYYSSSTSAYMLMYRRIDPQRNAKFTDTKDLPEHVQALLEGIKQEEEAARQAKELERATCRVKVYYAQGYRGLGELRSDDFHVHMDTPLVEAVGLVHKLFHLRGLVDVEHCRLVKYDDTLHTIELSYENCENKAIGDILEGVRHSYPFQLLLEVREPDKEFEVYAPNMFTVRCHMIRHGAVRPAVNIRATTPDTVQDLTNKIARFFTLDPAQVRLAVTSASGTTYRHMANMTAVISAYGLVRGSRVFVGLADGAAEEAPDNGSGGFVASSTSTMARAIDRHLNEIELYLRVPVGEEVNEYRERVTRHLRLVERVRAEQEERERDEGLRPPRPSTLQKGGPGPANQASMGEPSPPGTATSDKDLESESANSVADTFSPAAVRSKCTLPELPTAGEPSTENTTPMHITMTYEENVIEDDKVTEVGDQDDRLAEIGDEAFEGGAAGGENSEFIDRGPTSVSPVDEEPPEIGPSANEKDAVPPPPPYTSDDEADISDYGEILLSSDVPLEEVSTLVGTRTILARVDKRHTILSLKKTLGAGPLCLDHGHIKLFRQYGNGHEFECSRLNESLSTCASGGRMVVRLGQTLQRDEVRIKVHLFDLASLEPNASCLFDLVVPKAAYVREVQIYVAEELRLYHNTSLKPFQCRLRKKSWKVPSKIFQPDQQLSTMGIYDNLDVFVEFFPEDHPHLVKRPEQGSLFIRQWFPAEYRLGPIEEIFITDKTVAALKHQLSNLKDIPAEHVEIGKPQVNFPWEISVLEVEAGTEVDWKLHTDTLHGWPIHYCDEGTMLMYRDNRQKLGELSSERRKELGVQEQSRAQKNNKNSYAPKKEKALKIYTDTSPKSS